MRIPWKKTLDWSSGLLNRVFNKCILLSCPSFNSSLWCFHLSRTCKSWFHPISSYTSVAIKLLLLFSVKYPPLPLQTPFLSVPVPRHALHVRRFFYTLCPAADQDILHTPCVASFNWSTARSGSLHLRFVTSLYSISSNLDTAELS
jgi:hypothetical protein